MHSLNVYRVDSETGGLAYVFVLFSLRMSVKCVRGQFIVRILIRRWVAFVYMAVSGHLCLRSSHESDYFEFGIHNHFL
mgnify:CR=1 FL=1